MSQSPEIIKAVSQGAETPKPPMDDFFFHAVGYVDRHKPVFIGIAVALLVVLLGGIGFFEWSKTQTQKRSEALYELEALARTPAKVDAALNGLEQFAKENSGSPQAHMARLLTANLRVQKKDFLKAGFELEQLLNELSPENGMYVLVQIYLSNLLRDQGKPQEALAVLERGKGQVMEDALLLEKGETLMVLDKKAEAKTQLTRLMQAYPDSLYKQRAQQLLELL